MNIIKKIKELFTNKVLLLGLLIFYWIDEYW